MPSSKRREFDDTWKKEELEKSLKGSKRDREREKSRKREDEDRHHRRKEDDERRERRHRENGESEKREKHKSSRHKDDEDDRERRHRRHRDDDDGDIEKRHRRHRDEDDEERERRHRRHRDENDEDREKRHRRHKDEDDGDRERHRRQRDENDGDRGRRNRRHRDENAEDRERRHRRHREEEGDEEDRERRHRRHRTDEDDERREHRRHRDRDYDKDEDEDGDRKHKRREETEEERRKRKEKEREKRHREENGERRRHRDDDRKDERRSKRGDDDEEERRRRHEERKKEREREKEKQKEKDREEENEKQRKRQKEREREAEKERERNQRDRGKKNREKKEEKQEEAEGGDEEDDYNYEEDFEDYDDDFEDDDDDGDDKDDTSSNKDGEENSEEQHSKGYYTSLDWDAGNATPNEVDDVMKAMNEENERLMRDAQRMKKQPSPYNSYDEDEEEEKPSYRSRPKTAQRTFINFVSAKQREVTGKAASKTMRRFKELRELVELDVARFDIFDMPPVNEYELYMRSFGSSNTRQAYVQTNEDNIDREIQTEEIETREIWVQNTPEAVENVGGPDFEKKEDEFTQISKQESARRAMMWDRTVNAMTILLEEDAAERIHGSSEDRKQSNICLSEAFQEIETESFSLLKDRTVTYSHFSPVQTHMLLTVHKSKHNQSSSQDKFSNKGILCVWNVNSPNCPQKVLLCESQPRCCCFSPNKATLAFAGMHDGSVLVWDLRESSDMHKDYKDSDIDLVLRYPTYSTAGVLQYDNHQSAVIAIQPILAPNQSGSASEVSTSSEDGGEGLSFQLATLEQHSVINLWVVAEITHSDPAGSESDLGLSPGGRVKLIKSSTIQLESPLRDARLRTTMQAFDMKLLPSNNSHFYVATDSGSIIHGVRYGGKAPPKAHQPESESPVRVTSIDFSPFPEPVFLAGCEDGTLRLHHTDCEYPLITWPDATGGVCIQAVCWCRSRPSVFFVLDAESRMHIWDMLMSDAVPMKFEKIAEERVTSIDLSNDHSATGVGLPGRKPQMVISLESGSTEVHTLSREFSALMGDELDQFRRLIQRIT